MLNIIFYFQVHQPYRLKNYRLLDIGEDDHYFDERLNEQIIKKVGDKCYLPANKLLLELCEKYEGRFKISFSISGIAIEQFKKYYPQVLDSFKKLAQTGCVEFLTETYYHSLAFLYDKEEFIYQIKMHRDLMQQEFGYFPIVFRNTELIYQDRIADIIADEYNFKVILAEGADKILNWRSPLYAYRDYSQRLYILTKYYSLSDDIAFRFSNREWPEYPLTVSKFVNWISRLSLIEKNNRQLFLNLFMDYETFGEHQWKETGIFQFLKFLPAEIFKYHHLSFAWPSDVIDIVNYEPEALSFPEIISWADTERDLSAWLENNMQKNAIESLYSLFYRVKKEKRWDLLPTLRKLSTSDHLYYMSTKYFQDGDVHKYFSPYKEPEQVYIFFLNALADLEERLEYGGK